MNNGSSTQRGHQQQWYRNVGRGKSGLQPQQHRSNMSLNSDLNMSEQIDSLVQSMQSTGTVPNGRATARNSGGLSQTQKFSFGFGHDLTNRHQVQSTSNLQHVQARKDRRDQPCHTTREPEMRPSCLQNFTQRHMEANGGQNAKNDDSNQSTNNDGNILTFRGSRQNNESHRESIQTDRQHLLQTTFGNLGSGRGKASPPNDGGSSEQHKQSLTIQMSNKPLVIRSDREDGQDPGHVESEHDGRQFDQRYKEQIPLMSKYLEDHTGVIGARIHEEGQESASQQNRASGGPSTARNQTLLPNSKDTSILPTRIKYASTHYQKSNLHSTASSGIQWQSQSDASNQLYRTERGHAGYGGLISYGQLQDGGVSGQHSNQTGKNSVISYHISNNSNASQHQNASHLQSGAVHMQEDGVGAKYHDGQRLEALMARPTASSRPDMSNPASMFSSSLADVRSKFQLATDGQQRLAQEFEQYRPRLIETVYEQDESSSTSNMKHVMQSTSQNFDLSNHNQNSKSGDSHNVFQLPSPFQNVHKSQDALDGTLPPELVDQRIQNVDPQLEAAAPEQVSGPGPSGDGLPLWQSNLCQIQRELDNYHMNNRDFTKERSLLAAAVAKEHQDGGLDIVATVPGSQMSSHFNSQDFNEFNSNEITTDNDVRPSQKMVMETCMGSNHEDEIAEEEQTFLAPPKEDSSVPNAFRKVVHQQDSHRPPTASSCLTDNPRNANELKVLQVVNQMDQLDLSQYRSVNAANLQHYVGASLESQTQMRVDETPQESERTFLHRSYLKNISANQSGTHEKNGGATPLDQDFRKENELEVNEETQSTISHSQYLQGAIGHNERTVPRNQNTIMYDNTDLSFQLGPKSVSGRQQLLQRSQNRIERSPLNEKVLLEELVNNGYAHHDGSQAKLGSAQARANKTRDDSATINDNVHDRGQIRLQDRQRNMSIHEGSSKQSHPPTHHHTNTMVTTEGEYLENISEHVLTRPVSLNRQFNPDLQRKSKDASSTDIADENSGHTLPTQRADMRHKSLMDARRQQNYEPMVNNRESIRELLELPRDDPTLPTSRPSARLVGDNVVPGLGPTAHGPAAQGGIQQQETFDLYRKVDGELQASPSRVMDDRQPGYNSRLDHTRDHAQTQNASMIQENHPAPSSVVAGPDVQTESTLAEQSAKLWPQLLFSQKNSASRQASKTTANLNPACRLVYSYNIYQQGNEISGTVPERVLTENYKIFNPSKPKLCWFKFTRISHAHEFEEKAVVNNFEKVLALFKDKMRSIDCQKQWNLVIESFSHLFCTCSTTRPQDLILVDGPFAGARAQPKSIPDHNFASHQEHQEYRSHRKNRNGSKQKIHEILYRESELKREKLRLKQKEREIQMMQKEFDQCTFSPQPFKSDGLQIKKKDVVVGNNSNIIQQYNSTRDEVGKASSDRILLPHSGSRANPMSSSEKRIQILKFLGSASNKDSCQSDKSAKLVPKIRSPDSFFRDMMIFKDRREEKLKSIRKEQDSLIKKTTCVYSKRFSSTQEQDQFFENLSKAKKKTGTSSKSVNINLKNLAQQSNIKLFENRDGQSHQGQRIQPSPKSFNQRQELLQRLEKRSRSNKVQTNLSTSLYNTHRGFSKPLIQQIPKTSEPSTQSNRNLSQRSEMLYQDHFLRQSRLKNMKEKSVRFEAQQNLTERSQPTQKSNQILANRIALNVKTEYDRIIEQMKDEILGRRRMEKKKATDVVIEEKSGESERELLGSKRTMRSAAQAHEQWSQDTDYQPQIDGVDLQRFVQLLSRLHYLSDVNDEKVIVHERTAIRNAWQLISHIDVGSEYSPYPPDTPIVNLRNLLIFLIGIENIFIESMACNQQQEVEITGQMGSRSSSSYRQRRPIGFFIGQNYFLKGEQDCLKLMQSFNLFVHNKLCHQREHQQLANKEKLIIQKEIRDQGSFHPIINRKSEQIIFEKNQGLYTRTTQSKADSLERHTGQTSSARGTEHVTSQKQSKDQRLRKVGSKYEDFLISKAQQKKMKIQRLAKQVSRDQTKECTFTPRINKSNVIGIRGGRASTKDSKSQSNKENQMSQTCILPARTSSENVFESLYKFAEVRREKSEDGKRNALFIEKKQLKKQCPFRPNLSKTQKINKSVNSKIYQYKEPDLQLLAGKERQSQRQPAGLSALTTALVSSRTLVASPGAHQRGRSKKGAHTARSQVNIIQNNYNYTTVTDAFRDPNPISQQQNLQSESHISPLTPAPMTTLSPPMSFNYKLTLPTDQLRNPATSLPHPANSLPIPATSDQSRTTSHTPSSGILSRTMQPTSPRLPPTVASAITTYHPAALAPAHALTTLAIASPDQPGHQLPRSSAQSEER